MTELSPQKHTSDSRHRWQFLLKVWFERLRMAWLRVIGKHRATTSNAIAATTHTRVIAQPSVLQVRMQKGICSRYASLLATHTHTHTHTVPFTEVDQYAKQKLTTMSKFRWLGTHLKLAAKSRPCTRRNTSRAKVGSLPETFKISIQLWHISQPTGTLIYHVSWLGLRVRTAPLAISHAWTACHLMSLTEVTLQLQEMIENTTV